MCGILAMIDKNGKRNSIVNFKKGLFMLEKRGPDTTKINNIGNINLGFTRLAIMDTSSNGQQPMELNNVWLVCNGEIYNWKELAHTYKFNMNSSCDCEVILWMYNRFGIEETLYQLDGVFSFVLYDRNTKQTFMARDPYGVRPLYWGFGMLDFYVFGSEVKSLIDLDSYMNIYHFPPGCYMHYKDNKLKTVQYHKRNYMYRDCCHDNVYEILINLKYLLTEAVRKRMQADRPIGCLVSGGLDSSLVAAIANTYLPRGSLMTFSIGFTEGSSDLEYADKVAEYLGTKHYKFSVPYKEFIKAIDKVIRVIESYDITTVRASVGNYLVCKYARANTNCKVILNGDGSEEIFGSYKYFEKAPNARSFFNENCKLLRQIYMYDVLRSDRCISGNGLEARTPFLDKTLVEYVMKINPELKMSNMGRMEKWLLRKAFDSSNLLPKEVLWRKKEAFSDGVSVENLSWHTILQEHFNNLLSDEFYLRHVTKYSKNVPRTKEALYYRMIFDNHYPGCGDLVSHYWMPNWSDAEDPSARVL